MTISKTAEHGEELSQKYIALIHTRR